MSFSSFGKCCAHGSGSMVTVLTDFFLYNFCVVPIRFSSCSEASSYYTDGSMAVGGVCRSRGSNASDLRHSDLELVRAAERGDTNSVKTLLSSEQVSSVDIGVGATYRTPLHRAAGYGQVWEYIQVPLSGQPPSTVHTKGG